jgi:hypothetical protein
VLAGCSQVSDYSGNPPGGGSDWRPWQQSRSIQIVRCVRIVRICHDTDVLARSGRI